MRFKTLPGTGVQVSIVCLGTMNFGQQNSEFDAHAQLDYAVSQGVNFIDTAEIYPIPPDKEKQGLTETYIGTWLKKRGKRDDLIIASKVASGRQGTAFIGTRDAGEGLTKKGIMEAIDGTLQRLQTDHIDLYQVHSPERSANYFGERGVEMVSSSEGPSIEETLDGLAEVVKQGKARWIGISNETPWGVMEYLRIAKEKKLPRIITIQNQYSLLNRTFEIGLSEMCLRENIGLLPYSVLSMGVLTGKYLGGAKPAGARFTLWQRNQGRYNPPHAQEAVRRYVELARTHGMDPATLALAFSNDRPFVTSTILGATSVEQLMIDIASADTQLSPEIMREIAAIYQEIPDPTA